VKYWVLLGCWISPCYGPFSLGVRFESHEPFIYLIFNFFRAVVNRGYRIGGYGGTTVLAFQATVPEPAASVMFPDQYRTSFILYKLLIRVLIHRC
jgi:hypothetical protein